MCVCRAVSQETYAFRMLEKVSRGLANDDGSKQLGKASEGSLSPRFQPIPAKVQEAFTEVLEKSYSEADEASSSYIYTDPL